MNTDKIEGKIQEVAGRAESGLGDALGDAQSSIGGRVREARGVAQEGLGQVKDQVGEAAARAAEFAHDVYDNREQYAERGREMVGTQVGNNPLISLLLAGFVGLLFGLLLGRDRR